jgi:hypothetical protein
VWFCHGVFLSPWRGQVAFWIENPTTRLFCALHWLSNETSFVSGDPFFMEMLKFEVRNSFLLCGFVMASLSRHGEAKSHSESKIRQHGCFVRYICFLMRPHSSLGTHFSWRCRNLKFEIRFCCVVLSWHLCLHMERPSRILNRKSDNTAVLCLTLAF